MNCKRNVGLHPLLISRMGLLRSVRIMMLTALVSGCHTPIDSKPRSEVLIPSNHILGGTADPMIGLGKPLKHSLKSTVLTLYIGGDGQVEAQSDPSPKHPVASQLAASDAGAWILGRPCYQLLQLPSHCTPRLWQDSRYSDPVVASMTNVIQQLSVHTGSGSIRLVGYSGGGTLAVLLSDRITSVTEVITIAAPLDLKAWAHLRGASPPKASLDPIQHHKPGGASGITRYLHLVGGRDSVVPLQQAVAYSARFPEEHFRTFPLYDHVCCWVRDWPNLLQDITER